MPFDRHAVLEDISRDWWRVYRSFSWHDGQAFSATVEEGQMSDLGSIPWIAGVVGLHRDDYPTAYVLHDMLYQRQFCDQRTADAQLYKALVESGAWRWQAWLVWMNLRLFGWLAWNQHARENEHKAK